ncbi:16S rRNA (uracil(1498)-N(3))-methyltransferase [Rickettsia endosymbiont of Halotydeus destructor]|uniref:16S rRNA (uracil(1498)-N(3))-methyltransferase n=1 Tax=Rickettsia endosymbiont of Halotydeus destructor TaxID=2996754 RepID=UPI003BAFF6EE
MKFSNLNRIYINSTLAVNSEIELTSDHIHYIKTVLRLKVNEQFRVFNNTDGEFIAQINAIGKNNLSVTITNLLRKPTPILPLTIVLAIIKPEKFLLAVNMAVQLGVTKIVPLITERCQFRNIKSERLLKCVIEANEQSERLTMPLIDTAITLENYLAATGDNLLLYANEREDKANSLLKVLLPNSSDISLIIGPEGGFTDEELKKLADYENAKSFSLGAYILRTETAVAAGLAQIAMVRA